MAANEGNGQPRNARRIPRPVNSFILFSNDNRSRVSQLNPDLNNWEISRRLGHMWRELTLEQRNQYWLRSYHLYRRHMREHPDYVYNPFEARRRKSELKNNKYFKKYGNYPELTNGFTSDNSSQIKVWKATDEPQSRLFQDLSSLESLRTSSTSIQNPIESKSSKVFNIESLFRNRNPFHSKQSLRTTVVEVRDQTRPNGEESGVTCTPSIESFTQNQIQERDLIRIRR